MQIVFIFMKSNKYDLFSHWLLLFAGIALIADIVYRSVLIEFIALTNMYESLVFFSAVISIVLFTFRLRLKEQSPQIIIFTASVVTVILLAIASSPIVPSDIMPPVPALQSSWLVLHISVTFVGESFFVIGFAAAVYYLLTKDDEKKKKIDSIMYRAIAIGYPIYTAGALIFGSIWAYYAWSRFWGWDPKEIFALVTWLVYTIYLHSRFIKKLRGNVSAMIVIAGFLLTLFTFFGVNYLLSGLHSYK